MERIEANLQIATTGIHSTEVRMRMAMRNSAHIGHSCLSVMPLLATHAEYPLPSKNISTKDATKILNIASGLRYFQHINQ